MGGEDLSGKERGSIGNDGDIVPEHGMKHLQCRRDLNDFRLVLVLIGYIPQVNESRGIGTTAGIGHDTFNQPYAINGGYLASADNLQMITRW